MKFCHWYYFGLVPFFLFSVVSADTVLLKATKETLENVKTSPAPKKGETLIEEKGGATRIVKTNQIVVTPAPVVWEDPKPVVQEQGFFAVWFGKKPESSASEPTSKPEEAIASNAPKAPKGSEATPSEEKTFFDKRFPEIAFGTMAFFWLFL